MPNPTVDQNLSTPIANPPKPKSNQTSRHQQSKQQIKPTSNNQIKSTTNKQLNQTTHPNPKQTPKPTKQHQTNPNDKSQRKPPKHQTTINQTNYQAKHTNNKPVQINRRNNHKNKQTKQASQQ